MDGKITYSRRKSLSLRIAPDGSLDIRAPIGMPRREIDRFLEEKADWIATHRAQVLRDRQQGALHAIGAEQLETLKELAREPIYESLRRFAPQMGVNYGRVTIRCQKSRWGSCSSAGNLNFNCLLALAPREVLDYVVVHELAHRLHMDHSAAFWQEVEKVLPDYRVCRDWLRQNGGALLARTGEMVRKELKMELLSRAKHDTIVLSK